MKPLFANPVLFLLTIALTDYIFQDYKIFEEIETISPFANESLHHFRIKKEIFRVSIFQIISADGSTGKIYGANSFNNRTVNLGHRVGYEENIGIYDIRKEILVKIDDKFLKIKYLFRDIDSIKDNDYSIVEKMKFVGHNNVDIFFDSYTPELNIVDGMINYWNKKRRIIYLKDFADYHFIIIFSCCNRYQQRWKSIWRIVSISSSSTKRSKCWERNFDALQKRIKSSQLESGEKNFIDGNDNSYPTNLTNDNRFNPAK